VNANELLFRCTTCGTVISVRHPTPHKNAGPECCLACEGRTLETVTRCGKCERLMTERDCVCPYCCKVPIDSRLGPLIAGVLAVIYGMIAAFLRSRESMAARIGFWLLALVALLCIVAAIAMTVQRKIAEWRFSHHPSPRKDPQAPSLDDSIAKRDRGLVRYWAKQTETAPVDRERACVWLVEAVLSDRLLHYDPLFPPSRQTLQSAVDDELEKCHLDRIHALVALAYEIVRDRSETVAQKARLEMAKYEEEHAKQIVANFFDFRAGKPVPADQRVYGSMRNVLRCHADVLPTKLLVECAKLVDTYYTYRSKSDDDRYDGILRTEDAESWGDVRSLARAELERRKCLHLAGPEPKARKIDAPRRH
jgi:hypothetical protein